MLAIGLGTEVFIFALSAFEPPFRNYHWEEVFPVLKTRNEEDRPNFSNIGGEGIIINGPLPYPGYISQSVSGQQKSEQNTGQPAGPAHQNPVADITPQQAVQSYGIPPQVQLSEEDAQTLSESIKRMGEAVTQMNNMADITVITEKYLNQLSEMADNLNRFSTATASLSDVSNVLLDSYKNITENSSDISNNSKGYVEQLGVLNKNLFGLNTIYEIQLKSISSQIDTIDRVNKSLLHTRDMYEGSMDDSERFRKETEAMAANLAKLNMVYSRMLEAMTPGYGFGGGFNPGNPSNPTDDTNKL
jgi:methyl-accepting chemotaxis protein